MLIWRLGTESFPIWDGSGAALHGGRWNPAGMPAIYAASSLSLAMLERLAQRSGFRRAFFVRAEVPDDLPVTDLMDDPPSDWRSFGSPTAAGAGGAWLLAAETAVLRVPSVVVPREANFVVNPGHPHASRIVVSEPESIAWDPRLFGVPPPA